MLCAKPEAYGLGGEPCYAEGMTDKNAGKNTGLLKPPTHIPITTLVTDLGASLGNWSRPGRPDLSRDQLRVEVLKKK